MGHFAVLTANVCTANPDFVKIRSSKFEEFYYETFDLSIKNSENGNATWALWEQGVNLGLLRPQLHGREHLHALAWLKELSNGNIDLLKAFEHNSWGIPYQALFKQRRKNLQAALDIYEMEKEFLFQKQWLMDSVDIFEDKFGFKSKSFIAPAYTWHSKIHRELKPLGIDSLQGIKLQYQPRRDSYMKKLHFMGEYSKSNDIYFFPRNVFFEPSLLPNKDWYSETLRGVEFAFKNNMPAIIGSHRINFIGKLKEANRTDNLDILTRILSDVVKKYPDVIFTTSDKIKNYF